MNSKRKMRRWASGLAALAIAGSALAIVAAPVQAANTASEVLVDSNDDGTANAREFAGRNRYDTSVRLAERYATDLGAVSTVLVASGISLVDAVASAGLAGLNNAPVLLTPPTRLHASVANFIEEYGVGDVIILGGEAAVSVRVANELEGLDSAPTVSRLSGTNRYDTAAAISDEIGAGTWCGSSVPTALMINGASSEFADAILIGPLAAALSMPILLTDGSTLSAGTADFIDNHQIEEIVIIGGESAVGESVEDTLMADYGVVDVQRIAGATAYATATEVADLAYECDDVVVDNETVALVNRYATADGVSAAPVLATGLDSNGVTPILLVADNTVPNETKNWLAATPEQIDGEFLHLGVLAIGGTAVVSKSAMDAAVSAANSGGNITVSISAGETDDEDRRQFVVEFSADVDSDKVTDKSMYRIVESGSSAGRRLFASEAIAVGYRKVTISAGSETVNGDTVPYGFPEGTELQVVGAEKVGVSDDQRTLEGGKYRLPRLPRDTSPPNLTVAAFEGGTTFYVMLDEENLADGEVLVDTEFTLTRKDDDTLAVSSISGPDENGVYTVTANAELVANDQIVIDKDALRDENDRQNRRVTHRVPDSGENLRITNVYVSSPNRSGAQASATLFTEITITTKKGGSAAGAQGNDWRIVGYDDREDGYEPDNAPRVDVTVFPKAQLVEYVILENSGDVTQAELAAALEADKDFAASFEVSFDTAFSNGVAHPSTTAEVEGALASTTFSDGQTSVAVSVGFTDAVANVSGGDCSTGLLHTDGCSGSTLAGVFVEAAPEGVTRTEAARFAGASQRAVVITYTSDSEDALPTAGTAFVITVAATGYAATGDDAPESEESTGRLRRSAQLKAQLPAPTS